MQEGADVRFDYLNRRVDDGFTRVDEKFDELGERISRLETDLSKLNQNFADLNRAIIRSAYGIIGTMLLGFTTVLAAVLG